DRNRRDAVAPHGSRIRRPPGFRPVGSSNARLPVGIAEPSPAVHGRGEPYTKADVLRPRENHAVTARRHGQCTSPVRQRRSKFFRETYGQPPRFLKKRYRVTRPGPRQILTKTHIAHAGGLASHHGEQLTLFLSTGLVLLFPEIHALNADGEHD